MTIIKCPAWALEKLVADGSITMLTWQEYNGHGVAPERPTPYTTNGYRSSVYMPDDLFDEYTRRIREMKDAHKLALKVCVDAVEKVAWEYYRKCGPFTAKEILLHAGFDEVCPHVTLKKRLSALGFEAKKVGLGSIRHTIYYSHRQPENDFPAF
jgi:hypothetical protein